MAGMAGARAASESLYSAELIEAGGPLARLDRLLSSEGNRGRVRAVAVANAPAPRLAAHPPLCLSSPLSSHKNAQSQKLLPHPLARATRLEGGGGTTFRTLLPGLLRIRGRLHLTRRRDDSEGDGQEAASNRRRS